MLSAWKFSSKHKIDINFFIYIVYYFDRLIIKTKIHETDYFTFRRFSAGTGILTI